MSDINNFGKGKTLFKSKGYDKAEKDYNDKKKVLAKKAKPRSYDGKSSKVDYSGELKPYRFSSKN